MTETIHNPVLPPPDPPKLIKWMRDNLFSNWFNSILTLISIVIFYFLVVNAVILADRCRLAPHH